LAKIRFSVRSPKKLLSPIFTNTKKHIILLSQN
jgi:hypothetical protein